MANNDIVGNKYPDIDRSPIIQGAFADDLEEHTHTIYLRPAAEPKGLLKLV